MGPLPEPLLPLPAGRRQLSPDVIAHHQRDRVLAAAVPVFAKRGYQGTTVDHIVAAAQIGVGSFYALFEGKEDCFLQAYDRILSEGMKRIAASLPAEAQWPEAVCIGLRAALEEIVAEPFAARILFVEAPTAGPAALARYEETIDGLAPLLRLGREFSPVAAELPATLEVAILGGLLWFLQRGIVQGKQDGSTQQLTELAEIVLEPYVGRDETERLLSATQSTAALGR